ncbi:hypothetical protein JCM1841_006275 [Sporobolomyces salmonicolor]
MAPIKKGKGKGKTPELDANGRPPKIKRVKEVVFDPESRKEYLTGFSKRKKAKQTARRNKAIEREKDELRKMRTQIREDRKERAAHNVRVAQEMYGDAGADDGNDEEDGSDSDGGSDAESDEPEPTAYETPDAVTTVVVEPLSLSRSPSPVPVVPPPAPAAPSTSSTSTPAAQQQQSSMHKKRVKNGAQARPKMSRADKKERATGGKGKKKKMEGRMKGTKGRAHK